MRTVPGVVPFASLFLLLALAACSSTYYSAMEKVGIEKRDMQKTITEADAFIQSMEA